MSIYFDNSATTYPKPKEVVDSINNYLTSIGSNPGRSGHKGSIDAGMMVYKTRKKLAGLYSVKNPMRVIMTSGGTESLNLAILGLCCNGDHVITTSMEHNSVLRPLNYLKDSGIIDLSTVKGDSRGFIEPDDIKKSIKPETKLIVINHISNVNGVVQDIKSIGKIAREKGVTLLVDGAQSGGLINFSMDEYGVDLIALTGHKGFYGPTGTGALIISDCFDYKKIKPLMFGGTGSKSESDRQPDFLPDMFESGTLNITGIYGLYSGLEFINKKSVLNHKQELIDYFLTRSSEIDGINNYQGSPESGVISFTIDKISVTKISNLLFERDIMVRQGLHCAPMAHKTLGTFPEGTIRISFSIFNIKEEIDILIETLKEI